jgi:nicotinamidase/pyrazinamidase
MEKNPPLLFWDVDTQVDFLNKNGRLYVTGAESILPNLGRLTGAARRHDIPVIASADDHEPGDAELSDDPDFEATYPPHCLRGTPGQHKVPQTSRDDLVEIGHEPLSREDLVRKVDDASAVLLLKKRFDVFTNPNAERVVELVQPGHIVLYGVALDVCVLDALEGLWERGHRDLTVVTDATAAIDPDKGEELLEEWERRGVELVTTDQVLERLEERMAEVA